MGQAKQRGSYEDRKAQAVSLATEQQAQNEESQPSVAKCSSAHSELLFTTMLGLTAMGTGPWRPKRRR